MRATIFFPLILRLPRLREDVTFPNTPFLSRTLSPEVRAGTASRREVLSLESV